MDANTVQRTLSTYNPLYKGAIIDTSSPQEPLTKNLAPTAVVFPPSTITLHHLGAEKREVVKLVAILQRVLFRFMV